VRQEKALGLGDYFLGADGTLYFASDRAPAVGGRGYDLYRSALICVD